MTAFPRSLEVGYRAWVRNQILLRALVMLRASLPRCVALLAIWLVWGTASVQAQESSLASRASPSAPSAAAVYCAPRIVSTQAVKAGPDPGIRPERGWVDVTLPESWSSRWPGYGGTVWYRIDWERDCGDTRTPIALGLDGMSSAGEVFINGDLLWRDASLVEPLTRNWNVPRSWILPASSLHPGVNTVWIRVVGVAYLSPGLGALRLGEVDQVHQIQRDQLWQQRTVYFVNAVLSAAGGVIFLMVWVMRPKDQAYGYFGLMSLAWLLYLTTYLAETPWPFVDSLSKARVSIMALVAYVLFTCLFTFRFGGQRFDKVERVLWLLAALGGGALLLVPDRHTSIVFAWVWKVAQAVFLLNCVQFQWHAWRRREGERQLSHILLALVWLVFIVVAIHDYAGSLGVWQVARSWAALSGSLIVALMMLLLSAQLTQRMRSVEHFNRRLASHVTAAREELEQALAREHAQAVQHAKLQERVQIAHDLHDGLGASLVRGMALVEQAQEPVPNARMLSLLKTMRDDLRQMIDYGSSAGAVVPETPVQWFAPMRHRFTRILDELDVESTWTIAPVWNGPLRPSALQCLGITRMVEETVSNVIKHSQARHLRVDCRQPAPDTLEVIIADDGVGFNVEAVHDQGLSVGMRSLAARAARVGATLSVESGVAGTEVRVLLKLSTSAL